MIRRRSTLDHAQRSKHNKLVQIFAILDLCLRSCHLYLELPSDDRILIRNQIKLGDEQLEDRIYQCKKDKNYHSLQIYLRKCVQKLKQSDKFGFLSKTNNRGRTPQTLKSIKNATQSSYHNSLQNSLQSSPSTKKSAKAQITKNDIAKHIENQINKQIKRQIEKQECEHELKDITPRQIRVQIKPFQPMQRNCDNIISQSQLDMKSMIKAKINERQRNSNYNNILTRNGKQNFHKQIKQVVSQCQLRPPLTLSINPRTNDTNQKNREKVEEQQKYGQFYKRIKKVIEEAY